ncbi:hypothetical protein PAAL109150_03445 [Paenibacillus alkaliterrae]
MRFIREKTVVQLTYLPTIFPVNCYLVEEEDGLTLVDAALPNNVKAILQAAERMEKPITRIVHRRRGFRTNETAVPFSGHGHLG